MKREIKFRAWDKTNKCWLKSIYIAQDGWIMDNNIDDGRDDVDIQLFTGLKDKNGKEIYEGEILENKIEEMIISVYWDMTGANWKFNEYSDRMDDGVGRGNWDFKMGVAKNSKAIGNIHENKDLLK